MLSKKTIIVLTIFLLTVTFSLILGYKVGEANSNIDAGEINPIIFELLTKRTDLPLSDMNFDRVEYWDTSYFPFNLENNSLDAANVRFNGIYIPTGKKFTFSHTINIYRPGSAPAFTFAMKSYNDYISRNTNPKILELNEMDENSWGFCYLELNTCYMDTKYDDIISSIIRINVN